MITLFDASKGRINCDICVEMREGDLMSILEWHPSYMALRYPLLFLFGQQSWHDRVLMAGRQDQGDHLLHASRRNRTDGISSRHTLNPFDDEPEQEIGINPEHEVEANGDGEYTHRARGPWSMYADRYFILLLSILNTIKRYKDL